MITATSNHINLFKELRIKSKAYFELVKFRLSFLVAFSSGFGYVLGTTGSLDWQVLIMLCLGGFMISGAAIIINQIIEKDLDAMMTRTCNRPLPTRKVTVKESIILSGVLGILGLAILHQFTNPLTTFLSFVSMILYGFVYTPLKRVGPIAVFVGAIPGALPPLLGWVAITGVIDANALILFGIQFIWQFPHFWAIAWVSDEDYRKAGFKLLPGRGKKDLHTAFQIMTYTLFLIPLGLLPAKFGLTGINSAIVATVCGVLFLAQTFKLIRDCLPGNVSESRKSALGIMFGSFVYLPVVQIAFLLDKV
ncbi:MAG: heme o synthase [Cytophagales bacterium]|nr:heme o synthase [Cytophagales bacterium]